MDEKEGGNKVNSGMNLFLGIVSLLFIIGLVAVIFIISGNSIKVVGTTTTGGNVINESLLFSAECHNVSVYGQVGLQLNNVVIRYANGTIMPSSEYEVVGGCIKAK